MSNITLFVPEELKRKMEEFKIINWSEVAREAFAQKIKDLEFLKEFKAKSEMTEEDARKLGKKINEALAKRYNLASK